jgi:hypothetical protein
MTFFIKANRAVQDRIIFSQDTSLVSQGAITKEHLNLNLIDCREFGRVGFHSNSKGTFSKEKTSCHLVARRFFTLFGNLKGFSYFLLKC